MAVQEQAQVVLPRRQHDPLVTGALRQDHVVGVEVVLGELGNAVRARHPRREQPEDDHTDANEQARGAELAAKQDGGPQSHRGVHEPEQERRSHQAEMGHEQDRERDRRAEGTEVVERQHVGDHVLERESIPQDAHEERDLEPDEHADDRYQRVQHEAKRTSVRERQEQRGRGVAAHQGHEQLDRDEAGHESPSDVPRQPAADPHRAEIRPDDRRKLRHAVAQQVTRQRPRHELVDEPARGDQQD